MALDLDGATTTNDGTFGFTYSPASQVLTRSISKGVYAYTNGPSSQTLYAPNGLNQYGTIFGASTVTPTYDGNANMTYDGNFTYGYDVENRMVSATKAATTINLGYDPNGRLLTVDSGSAATSTHFLYDGDNLVAEYDSSNVLKQRYVHGPGADEPLVWYQGATVSATTRYFTIANHQGSIVAVTGATTQTNTYDVYGVPGSIGSTNVGRYQYTGQIWLSQIGLYYYKARIYNPALGRFMQTDPVGYKDDVNLYTYVGNDPLDRTDPTGLTCLGDVQSAVCKADYYNGKPITDSQSKQKDVVRYEQNETKSYVKALKHGDKTVTVGSINGRAERTFTGTQIAQKMQDQKTNIETRNGIDPLTRKSYQRTEDRAAGYAGASVFDSGLGQDTLRTDTKSVTLAGLAESDGPQEELGLHEALHEFAGMSTNDNHQRQFHDALRPILDGE